MYNKFQRDLHVKKVLHTGLLERQGKVSPRRQEGSPRKHLWFTAEPATDPQELERQVKLKRV